MTQLRKVETQGEIQDRAAFFLWNVLAIQELRGKSRMCQTQDAHLLFSSKEYRSYNEDFIVKFHGAKMKSLIKSILGKTHVGTLVEIRKTGWEETLEDLRWLAVRVLVEAISGEGTGCPGPSWWCSTEPPSSGRGSPVKSICITTSFHKMQRLGR